MTIEINQWEIRPEDLDEFSRARTKGNILNEWLLKDI
jgi:hypothetical protein